MIPATPRKSAWQELEDVIELIEKREKELNDAKK